MAEKVSKIRNQKSEVRSQKKTMISYFLFSVYCLLFTACPEVFVGVYCFADTAKHIRVAIIQDAVSLNLSVKGFYRIIDATAGSGLDSGKRLAAVISIDKQGILVKGVVYKTSRIFIEADDPESIIINNRKYRGNIEVIKKDNGCLLVVNYIEIENYIKGILYHEVSHYWPMEALKAQGIACRTYAVYQIEQNSSKDYDLTNDIYSQVYGGKTSERYRTSQAVEQTKGEMLTYKDKIFPAYFHAACAGHTLDADRLWNINMLPLKGTRCNFCKDSPHFNWHCVLPLREIKNKLAKTGFKIDNITDIAVLSRDDSGRIKELKIIGVDKEIKISSKDFRNVLGPNIIRSTNFEVEIAASDAVFDGIGWGHGVGMCQWGTYFMAKQGYDYRQILEYYYPGSEVK